MTGPAKGVAGKVNPEWLTQLPAAEVRRWITDLLHGREVDIPAALTETPEYVLLDAFEATSGIVRRLLVDAVLTLLEDMAWHEESPWRAEGQGFSPGDRLVWVAAGMKDESFVGPIRQMVDSREFIGRPGELPGGLHARLLQALMALGVEEPEAFWRGQVEIAPADFLTLAMCGLADHPTGNPFVLLSEFRGPWSEDMRAELASLVDLLRLTRGPNWLQRTAGPYRTTLRMILGAELDDMLAEAQADGPVCRVSRGTWGGGLAQQFREAA